MASKAFLTLLPIFAFSPAYAVPLDAFDVLNTTTQIVIVTAVVTSSVEVLETSTVLLSPTPSLDAKANATTTSLSSSSALPVSSLQPTTVIDYVTVTNIFTPPPVTITLWDPPVTTTEIITTTPAASSTTSVPPGTAWTAPAQMTDLSCFKVSDFAYGEGNMQVIQGIPAEASATTVASLAIASSVSDSTVDAAAAPPAPPTWDNASSVIQLYYPAGSVNPTTEPQGGADFYASPLDLSSAQNVSMSYSVFFPADFDWVLAGKLPGIYGGHETCSGGDDALSCFSTRLMWREGGMGELYLVSRL
jgi:hypothetical protein